MMDKETLLKLTVPKLREEALKIENIAGVHGMKKEELLDILFDHFDIPRDVETKKQPTSDVKKKIAALREEKDKVRQAGDAKKVKVLQKRIHDLKRNTRK